MERANNRDIAAPIVERALDLGVNYLDTSSVYGATNEGSLYNEERISLITTTVKTVVTWNGSR